MRYEFTKDVKKNNWWLNERAECEKIFIRGVLEALLNAEMDAEYYKERCKELETKAKE